MSGRFNLFLRQVMTAVIACLCLIPALAAEEDREKLREIIGRGDMYYRLGVTNRALESYREAAELSRQSCLDSITADVYNSIFAIYYYEREYKRGEDLLTEAEKLLTRLNDSVRLKSVLNNFGLLYSATGEPQRALDCLHRALDCCRDDSAGRASVMVNMADIYLSQDSVDRADRTLREAIALCGDNEKSSRPLIQAMLNLALIEAYRGHRREAMRLSEHVEKLLPSQARHRLPDTYAHLADICFAIGDSAGALRQILRYESIRDSIDAQQNRAQLRQLLVAYDTERLQQRNAMLRLAVEKRNLAVTLGIVVALALIIYVVLMTRRNRNDRRNNAIIVEQRERLLDYEREAHERNRRKLSREIDMKNRQLASFAIDQAAINEFHARTAETVAEARKAVRRGDIPEAMSLLSDAAHWLSHYGDNAVSDDFRVYFEQVHPDFFDRLSHRFPVLTQNDLRLCAFLYLGMSTKEIAALTHREVRSVESSRLRLRKKLDLPSDTGLHDFLKSINC